MRTPRTRRPARDADAGAFATGPAPRPWHGRVRAGIGGVSSSDGSRRTLAPAGHPVPRASVHPKPFPPLRSTRRNPGFPGGRRRAVAALAAALCAAACAPVVTHGPRVEPGWAGVGTLGVALGHCDSRAGAESGRCPEALNPMFAVGASYGVAPKDSTRPAYSFTGLLPIPDLASLTADAYVQAPAPRGGTVYGGGAQVSPRAVMPYVQVGRVARGGSGWYTTQGVVFTAFSSLAGDIHPPETLGDGIYAVYWTPGVAYRWARLMGALHAYASGALGRYHARRYSGSDFTPDGTRTLATLRVGMTVEIRRLRGGGTGTGTGRPRRCPFGRFCPPPRG
ncbi:MAG: hypothetical protein JWM27_4551 [Gemmatimonadetes bacterium]|nr:hypothetical protein [Gemmatimonadota bacterium]